MHKLIERGRPAIAALVLLTIAALAAGTAGAKTHGPRTADPLLGTWDTAALPLSAYRTALRAHGYSSASIDQRFQGLAARNHIKNRLEYELRFYVAPGGTHYEIIRYWDPTTGPKPPDSIFDHGHYKLLPGSRFTWAGTDPPTNTWVTTFRYAVKGRHLTLRFTSLVEPGVDAKQLKADTKSPILKTAGVYTRVGK